MANDPRSAVVALGLIGSSLLLMGLGAAFWYGMFHMGGSDRLVGGCLVAVGAVDAVFSLLFMNR